MRHITARYFAGGLTDTFIGIMVGYVHLANSWVDPEPRGWKRFYGNSNRTFGKEFSVNFSIPFPKMTLERSNVESPSNL
jgi:hypothetical protein